MRASECAGTGGRRRRILREEPAMPHTLHPEPTDDIKSSGLKATLPRVKVLQIFRDSKRRHLSAEDVFRALLAEGSDIGLATVYRVLVQFVQSGLLQRQHFEGGKAVFELDEGLHHDHLVCLRCGRVEEFFDLQIERRQREIARERGFELQEHALALYGVCSKPECRGAPAAPAS
jgi:Fur family transcriptional regulator, ferric uptake regulator